MDKFDIIIQGGQSNAEGFGVGEVSEEYVANPNVLYLEAEKKITQLPVSCAIEFLDKPYSLTVADYREGEHGKLGDFSLSFAKEYIDNGYLEEGRKILIIRSAVGGTGYKTNQWGKGKILEEKMFELVDYALSLNPENKVVAFLWSQGETEVLDASQPEPYEIGFKGTLDRVRATYGKDFPILACEFTDDFVERFIEYNAKILPVLRKTVNNTVNATMVGTKWLKSNDKASKEGDIFHFSRESLRFLGQRFFHAFDKLKKGEKEDFSLLSIGGEFKYPIFNDEEFDIIVQAGQSNADGSGKGPVSEEWIPSEDIYYLVADRRAQWFPDHVEIDFADKPFEWQIADERGDGENKTGDFSLTFAKAYAENYLQKGRKVLIIRTAVGATCFAKKDWGIGGRLYIKLMEMLDHALLANKNNKIVAFLWHQGESDALDHYDPQAYITDLKNMILHFRTRYDAWKVPFLSGDFVHHWAELPENKEMCDPIRAVCKQVAEETEYGAYIQTDGLKSNSQEWGANDFLHFSRESLHILGKKYFEAFKKIK